ncbi:YitT family protein [Chromohalobacter sp. HP20-39]|uniref:YitT family protein n=1 Tax=Chromohalobacter sp. HP20-39 TaxID=3079306 RepID=UPI00294AFE3C|nr:YitT family protein [Chromohalobacter sp. HP20-39]MDV6318450.1 YitT family protein [Chromohalobacter sp. HP20-39]
MKVSWRSWLTLLEGCLLVALGVRLLQSADLLVSGTAGLSLLISDLLPVSFGITFFVINLPFYGLAFKQLGRDFTLRTLSSVTLLSVLSDTLTATLPLGSTHPVVCAIAAGLLIGLGLALLFRANASLGGLNILALYLERRVGWHAGRTTLCCDLLLLLLAVIVYPWTQVAGSALAFLTLSAVLGRYHRKTSGQRHQPGDDDDEMTRIPRRKGALSPHRASIARLRPLNEEG